MNSSKIREGELKDVFDTLEKAFAVIDTDFYVIGAFARDVWYSRGDKTFRQTGDVDFAILVGSQADYESVKEYLKNNNDYAESKENSFVMITPNGLQIDILPFGEIEFDDGVKVSGQGLTSIKVNGFKEVYESGTEQVKMETGHDFNVATLPSIILLKLIAFDDRPEKRDKDPRDIASIILHYFDLQADFIYTEHVDLFEEEDDQTLEEISATVIGREIKKICADNINLLERLKQILQTHINENEESVFIKHMIRETGITVEKSIQLLQNIGLSLE